MRFWETRNGAGSASQELHTLDASRPPERVRSKSFLDAPQTMARLEAMTPRVRLSRMVRASLRLQSGSAAACDHLDALLKGRQEVILKALFAVSR